MRYELVSKPRGQRVYRLSASLAKAMALKEEVTIKSSEEKAFLSSLNNKIKESELLKGEEIFNSLNKERLELEQGSEEWKELRLGLITASSTPFTKDGTSIRDINPYIAQKATELVYKTAPEPIKEEIYRTDLAEKYNFLMERGNILESVAIESYLEDNNLKLISNPIYKLVDLPLMASLDCEYVTESGEMGILEVKSPSLRRWFEYKLEPQKLVDTYYIQLQTQMLASGYTTSTIIAYYPTMGYIAQDVEIDYSFVKNAIETTELFKQKIEELGLF
jgi:hypothetical protein